MPRGCRWRNTVSAVRFLDRCLGRVFAAFTAVYRWAYSRQMPRVCCFEPTCSVYAALVWSRDGFVAGMPLVIARLRRCDGGPFAGEDYPPGIAPLGPTPPELGAHV